MEVWIDKETLWPNFVIDESPTDEVRVDAIPTFVSEAQFRNWVHVTDEYETMQADLLRIYTERGGRA